MKKVAFYLKQFNTTYILIGFNALLFIISTVITLTVFNNDQVTALTALGAETLPKILSGEIWRLVTASFLHLNIIHIALNMYSLWVVGVFVERYFSGKKLFTIYMLTAISGSIFSVIAELISPASAFGYPISVGASGAIFGIVGLILGHVLFNKRYGQVLPINRESLIMITVANLGLDLLLPGINIAAHIGGLVGGILLAFIIVPFTNEVGWKNKVADFLFYLSGIILIVSIFAQAITFFNAFH